MTDTTPRLQHLLAHRDDIDELCRRHHVRRLDLFGSVAHYEAGAASDYDFLMEFDPLPAGGYTDAYFDLLEGLQALLDAPVELVVERAIRNPYFLQSVQARRAALYVAWPQRALAGDDPMCARKAVRWLLHSDGMGACRH